jgi:small-conductance mechanosensitive channel
MDELNDILERVYFGNTLLDYLIALGIVVVGFLLVIAFRRIILQRVKHWTDRTATKVDDYVVRSIERFGIPALYIVIVYAGLNYLTFTERGTYIVKIATTAAITFFAIRLVSHTLLLLLESYVRRQENGEEKVKQLGGIMLIINVIIWGIGLLFLFDNMGYDVTAVVAGLGIGGIAIALAAQNILGDLFNYFVIFLDRPFEIGDFIIIDDKMGVVEYIGVKTTRIKSLSGEQLVFANSDLTNSRIHNYKRMQRRRVVYKIGVVYQTPYEQVKKVPDLIKSIILEQDMTELDRSHFAGYGDWSLNFEAVYYVLSSDFNKHMDVLQAINLRIFEAFEKAGIEFAFPTRTLYVNTENSKKEEEQHRFRE